MNQNISISDKLCKLLNVNTYDHFRDITKMVAFDRNLSIKQMLWQYGVKTRKPSSC